MWFLPVLTTVSMEGLHSGASISSPTQKIRKKEGKLHRLQIIETRVTVSYIPLLKMGGSDVLRTTYALGDITSQLHVTPAETRSVTLMGQERQMQLPHDLAEGTRFIATFRLVGVAVHT